ncbi:MAG: para-aminobenzoate synthetase component, partial [Actinomycetota bacterium]|nr:para-aminobenzoate synthetase component [Actinomycetota bacterium]
MAASPADLLLAVLGGLPRDADVAVVRREPGQWVVGVDPEARLEASGAEALDRLDRLGGGWWAGWLAYDLGRSVERVERRRPDDLHLPDISLARFDARLVVDAGGVRLEGDGPTAAVLAAAAREADAEAGRSGTGTVGLAPFRSSLDRGEFEARVEEIVELVRAGECYQVNLTR